MEHLHPVSRPWALPFRSLPPDASGRSCSPPCKASLSTVLIDPRFSRQAMVYSRVALASERAAAVWKLRPTSEGRRAATLEPDAFISRTVDEQRVERAGGMSYHFRFNTPTKPPAGCQPCRRLNEQQSPANGITRSEARVAIWPIIASIQCCSEEQEHMQ